MLLLGKLWVIALPHPCIFFRAHTYAGSLYSSIFCRGYRQRRPSSNFHHLHTYTLPPLLVGATSPSSSQTMPLSTYIDRTKLSEVRLKESQTCESATRVQPEMTFPPPPPPKDYGDYLVRIRSYAHPPPSVLVHGYIRE